MNAQRRKQLEEARAILESAQERLDEAKQLLEAIRDDEQDYYDNMPESFQGGDKGCAAEAAIDQLSTAIDDIDLVDFDTFFNAIDERSEEYTSELQSLMRISYAVFCLKKKKTTTINKYHSYNFNYTTRCHTYICNTKHLQYNKYNKYRYKVQH